MSISHIRALPVGNALQVILQPPAGAEFWRVLRKTSDTFTGQDDAGAILVHDGDDAAVLDDRMVVNGVAYFYRAYYWNGSVWSASASVTATAQATYSDESVDALTLVRDRLESALKIRVQRGDLEHVAGGIPVLLAPPAFEDTRWPVVTVHLQNEAPGTRAVGELMFSDIQQDDGDYTDGEGYLADVQLAVIGWSLNADERSVLRKAIRTAVVANFPVFAGRGLVTPSFSQQDVEDFQSYAAPVYQTMGTFSCQAPIWVTGSATDVVDVEVSATEG